MATVTVPQPSAMLTVNPGGRVTCTPDIGQPMHLGFVRRSTYEIKALQFSMDQWSWRCAHQTSDVSYATMEDAAVALWEYNQRMLDGGRFRRR